MQWFNIPKCFDLLSCIRASVMTDEWSANYLPYLLVLPALTFWIFGLFSHKRKILYI